MKKYLLFFAAAVVIGTVGVFAYSNYDRPPETNSNGSMQSESSDANAIKEENNTDSAIQQKIIGTYAIQNVKTGKNLRPYNAGVSDGNELVRYDHAEWKCMTWRFNQVENNIYQLQNLYTDKTFLPSAKVEGGVALWQQPLNDESLQYWEFIEQSDEAYLIKLKGTDLYITISSDETNSPIILMPKQNSSDQQWKLVEQNPRF